LRRILIVMADRRVAVLIKEGLRAHGHSVRVVPHPGTASAFVDYEAFDLVIVDVGVEGTEGFELLEESLVGAGGPRVMRPDARQEAGELLAQALALLEEPRREGEPRLAGAGLELDPWRRRAWVGEVEVPLTEREFALLRIFLRHPGRVLSREALHQHAWGHRYRLGSNAVEVYVGYLRRKLGADVIETVRGRGYRLDPEARAAANHS
jgi:two-component system, OmpR family, copper resistance phosphate regulon response regulator CusR